MKLFFKRILAGLGLGLAVGAGGSLVTGESSLGSTLNTIILVGLGVLFVWLLFKFIKQ